MSIQPANVIPSDPFHSCAPSAWMWLVAGMSAHGCAHAGSTRVQCLAVRAVGEAARRRLMKSSAARASPAQLFFGQANLGCLRATGPARVSGRATQPALRTPSSACKRPAPSSHRAPDYAISRADGAPELLS